MVVFSGGDRRRGFGVWLAVSRGLLGLVVWMGLAMAGLSAARAQQVTTAWPPAALADVSGAAAASEDSLKRYPERVAQRVRLSGVAPGAAGRTIRWRVAADPLSGLSWEVDAARIAADGSFSLQGMFRGTMPTVLEIDYYSGTLFVTPGTDYRLRFHAYDYTLDRRLNVFFPGAPVPPLTFDIEQPADEGLNRALWAFVDLYGQEIDEAAYEQIAVYGRPEAVLRLRTRVDSLEAALWPAEAASAMVRPTRRDTLARDFVSAYIRYQMAALEEFAGLKSGKALARQYLRQQPLLYRNPAQMAFVRAYFEAYFDTKCPIPEKRLKRLLAGPDVQAVLDTLGVDSLLVNRAWREWVYILAAAEVMDRPDYPGEALRAQLAQLSARTPYPMHRQTVARLLERARRRREGPMLWPYSCLDEAGQAVRLDTLLGGGQAHGAVRPWTYVAVVKSNPSLSPGGAQQISALWQFLQKGARAWPGRGLVLVCDDDSTAAYTYMKELRAALSTGDEAADVPLAFCYFNRQLDWLRDWEVYTFPAFVVVSPEGRIYTRFAPPEPDGLPRWQKLMQPEKAGAAGNGKSQHGGR